MQGQAGLQSVVTYPVGAGLGQRIVIDGPRGAMFEYDASNNLVGSWASMAGTDPYGHAYVEGFTITKGSIVLSGSLGQLLVYFGTPAAGNLIASVAPANGTDTFGNNFRQGVTVYHNVGGVTTLTAHLNDGQVNFEDPTANGGAGFSHNAAIGILSGASNLLFFDSPAITGQNHGTIWLVSSSTTPQIVLWDGVDDNTDVLIDGKLHLAKLIGGLAVAQNTLSLGPGNSFAFDHYVTAPSQGGMPAAPMPVTQTDATSFTVTAAADTQASKAWSVPAADANAGTVYRLTVHGFGTEGSTAQTLQVEAAFNGTTVRSIILPALTASGAFRFRCVIEYHVKTTGAAGTYDITSQSEYTTTASPAVSSTGAFGSPSAGAETINTTIANTVQLNLRWAAVTGAPTITTYGSILERIGP